MENILHSLIIITLKTHVLDDLTILWNNSQERRMSRFSTLDSGKKREEERWVTELIPSLCTVEARYLYGIEVVTIVMLGRLDLNQDMLVVPQGWGEYSWGWWCKRLLRRRKLGKGRGQVRILKPRLHIVIVSLRLFSCLNSGLSVVGPPTNNNNRDDVIGGIFQRARE